MTKWAARWRAGWLWVQEARIHKEMADEPPDTSDPQSGPKRDNQGTLLLYSVLTGLTPLIPVPFVDDLVKTHVRRRLFRLLGEARGAGLGQDTIDTLARETSGGCLGGCLSQVFLYPLKKIFRKVFFFLEWKRAADLTSYTYHFGYLVDYALQKGLFAPGVGTGRVDEIRAAIERTCHEAPIRPVERAVSATFRHSHSALLSAATAVGTRLRGTGPRTDERAVAEAADPAATPQVVTVAASLGERMGSVPEEHFEQLRSRFMAHLANPRSGTR